MGSSLSWGEAEDNCAMRTSVVMSDESGDGSGMRGEYVRAVEIAKGWIESFLLGAPSNQSVGGFQEIEERVDNGEGGGDDVTAGADAGVKGLLCVGGLGGTVLMNDLKERTGFPMLSSEDDEEFVCVDGDRIWLRGLCCMPRRVASGSLGQVTNIFDINPSRRLMETKKWAEARASRPSGDGWGMANKR
jgi:hypothetical protein